MSHFYFYSYCYSVSFDIPVSDHVLLLRCLPFISEHQHIVENHLILPPGFWRHQSTDCWGNATVGCGNRLPHRATIYESAGIVEQSSEYEVADTCPSPLFLRHTPLSSMPADVFKCDCAEEICGFVHNAIRYQQGKTNNHTSASEAMVSGAGVCQDYAHIMIGICRNNHIPARYVVGMMQGEGETHAWVEVWHHGSWTAYDPTHNLRILNGYIKIAHGRDAADCQVCRGTYKGIATETSTARVIVKEL